MTWKELAIGLCNDKGHATYCPFRGCMCGATERQIEWMLEIRSKQREESQCGSTKPRQ